MLQKNHDEITEVDLQYLIDIPVLERKTLEYKKNLPGNFDKDKKEFLADVSSFANATGGDIIYGIAEDENHVPSALHGIEVPDSGKEILRLDSMIRDAIQPRIPNIHIRSIPLKNGRVAIIIRIPKSWLNPHIVTYMGSSKFYTRASNGKYQMDVNEIRSAFTFSESRIQKIKDFVQSRISDIYSDISPVPLTNFPKLAIHIIPFSSTDPQIIENFERLQMIPIFPMLSGSANKAFNADGCIAYSPEKSGIARGYVQIYRNGIIEAVSSFLSQYDKEKSLPILPIETEIISALKNYSNLLSLLRVDPPAFIFITLIKIKGLTAPKMQGHIHGEIIPIQKDIISLPNFELKIFGMMEDEADLKQLTNSLKLSFDTLSNSVGIPRSLSYNEKGDWIR